MTTTIAAEYQPALTPAPNPAAPPAAPEKPKPTRSDLEVGLLWLAGGATAATTAARAADPRRFDAYRTVEGLRAAGLLTLVLASGMTPGDALAERMAADEARRAAAMTVLEARGWNPARAHAALHGRDGGTLADAIRRVIDGEGWTGSSSCADCWQNHLSSNSRCSHWCHSRALAVQGTGTAAAA